VVVDLHSGWTTMKLEEAVLRLYASAEPVVLPETPVGLSLKEACSTALEEVGMSIVPWVQTRRKSLELAAAEEKAQVVQHYRGIVDSLESSKGRKGANLARIEDKIQSALEDRERRLTDVVRKYRLGVEVALMQMAVVSYPKVAVPLRLQRGRDQRLGVAVWDPLVHQGYFYHIGNQ
jgi:hypothetical protein